MQKLFAYYNRWFSYLGAVLKKILLPISCVQCGNEGDLLCKKCVDSLSPSHPTPLWIYAAFSYEKNASLRKVLYLLKYRGSSEAARILGVILARLVIHFAEDERMAHLFRLVHIPSGKSVNKLRPVDHAKLLAQVVHEISGIPYLENALRRDPVRKRQTECENRDERRKNAHNLFHVGDNVSGKIILLIDDITTTCATLEDAQRALKLAGAREVFAFVVAH